MAKLSESSDSESRTLIRAAGLRATPARVATLDLLRDVSTPLAHADVAEHLAKISVDKATAFRALNDMTEAGLLRKTELGDRVWRFELVAEGEHASHPHFICVDCGEISCLSGIKLTKGSMSNAIDVGNVTEILLKGHCNKCS